MDLTVICPYYNEGQIVEHAVRTMLASLSGMDCEWELIVVDDGSKDDSGSIVAAIAAEEPRLVALDYKFNRGRGHALRTGLAAARGEVIVTTEIDLSWGEHIVQELYGAMLEWPETDLVVASPHLPGGGYRNVPAKRVFLSKFGNHVIRTCMSDAVTMNTGMTRAYRRDAVQSMPLYEDRKEFHLEVILKAVAFGFRIREIPAVLEWKEYKHKDNRVVKRKSSSRVKSLILSHSLFSVFANPVRYVWGMAGAAGLLCVASFVIAVYLLATEQVSVYMAMLSVSLLMLSVGLFVLGVVLKQGNLVQRELWVMQRQRRLDARATAGGTLRRDDAGA